MIAAHFLMTVLLVRGCKNESLLAFTEPMGCPNSSPPILYKIDSFINKLFFGPNCNYSLASNCNLNLQPLLAIHF